MMRLKMRPFPGCTISLCQFLLPAPDVVFYANKGVKIVVQMRFSEDNKTFNYNDGECFLRSVLRLAAWDGPT